MIGIASGENLGLGFEPAKSARVNYAITVTLKIVAIGMLRLGKTPAARVLHMDRVGSQGLNHLIIESSDHWKSNATGFLRFAFRPISPGRRVLPRFSRLVQRGGNAF